MILSFSGDAFLATRAARQALRDEGLAADEVLELGDGMDARAVAQSGAQGGLFGRVGLLLDFDAAFSGRGGVKPRNDVVAVLSEIPEDAVVVVLDLAATAARQKRFREMGRHQHLPTPRFGALIQWVRTELEGAGLRFDREVPDSLVDLFAEDLPGIAGEITKLQLLDEKLTAERVRGIAGRAAVRDAFDLIEALVKGDGATALSVCQALVGQGEAPARVLGALTWQFDQVARCVALRQAQSRLSESEAAQALGLKPFVAKKSLAIAARLDEERLRLALIAILRADRAMKSGRNDAWALEALTLELSGLFAAR